MISAMPVLSNIPDNKPVRIYLPILNRQQRYRTQALYKSLGSADFELLFLPGTLPLSQLDLSEKCLVNVDFGGPNISMQAVISSSSEQVLRMNAENLISHDQMREFFRVDAVTEIISRSFQPDFFSSDGHAWSLRGKTIDISGNGILAVFSEKPPEEEPIRLELTLPTTASNIVHLLARPIRTCRLEENCWEVAFHFMNICDEDQDRIIGCCFEIQRRFLRLTVTLKH
jgi:hypothetical protein